MPYPMTRLCDRFGGKEFNSHSFTPCLVLWTTPLTLAGIPAEIPTNFLGFLLRRADHAPRMIQLHCGHGFLLTIVSTRCAAARGTGTRPAGHRAGQPYLSRFGSRI